MGKTKFYAISIGRTPGIYDNWDKANEQIQGISRYDYDKGFFKAKSWEEADEYLRTHELFRVNSSFDQRSPVSYEEIMRADANDDTKLCSTKIADEQRNSTEYQLQNSILLDNQDEQSSLYIPNVESEPYNYDENLERFLKKYYPDRSFTDEQKAAICAVKGAHLLYAIPGSGKTAVLTARAGYMIYSGIKANQMLIMTFGKNAALHMESVFKERFPSFAIPIFCTIHSFCFKVIKHASETSDTPSYNLICDEEDDPVPEAMDCSNCESWIIDESADPDKDIVDKSREDVKRGNKFANFRNPIRILERILVQKKYCEKKYSREPAEAAATIIGCIKNKMLSPDEIKNLSEINLTKQIIVNISEVFEAYQDELQNHNPPEMDFDDMLVNAYNVLKNNKEHLLYWQKYYPFVSVDEAQDTSVLQHAIIHELCSHVESLFMVGDDDQSIYAFRGATPETMLRFDQNYKNSHIHRMGKNFRSDSIIVSSGDKFIKNNKIRALKQMVPFSKFQGRIRIINIPFECQNNYLLNQTRDFIGEQKNKESPESLAILYRNNFSALVPLAYFFKYNIPFVSNKISDILTLLYCRVCINITSFLYFVKHPEDWRSYKNCYWSWNCYKGLFLNKDIAVDQLKNKIDANEQVPILKLLVELLKEKGDEEKSRHIEEIWNRIQLLSDNDKPVECIICLLEDLKYKDSLKAKSSIFIVNALIQIACLYNDISSFVDAITIMKSRKKWDENNEKGAKLITLSTMHSSKGEEYDRVIIIDANDSVIPGSKDLPFWHQTRESQIEEERRLFYVAATRARHELQILINYIDNNCDPALKPSRFVNEIIRTEPKISIEVPESDSLRSDFKLFSTECYYAVRRGRNTGIFSSFEEVKNLVDRYSSPDYKKFESYAKAENYLNKFDESIDYPSVMTPNTDLPDIVNQMILQLFYVESLDEFNQEQINSIRNKVRLFTKKSEEASAVDYSVCFKEYALVYLPVNFYKIWIPFNELVHDNRFPIDTSKTAIRILELGVGPGTSTLSVLLYYSKIAENNPKVKFRLEYTPVEYEPSFKSVFTYLYEGIKNDLAPNLDIVMNSIRNEDAFEYLSIISKHDIRFDLILESNMLNHNEHIDDNKFSQLLKNLYDSLNCRGKVILIEPGDNETSKFLNLLVELANSGNQFSALPLKTDFVDLSDSSLYMELCRKSIRNPLSEDRHWFRWTVLTKKEVTYI